MLLGLRGWKGLKDGEWAPGSGESGEIWAELEMEVIEVKVKLLGSVRYFNDHRIDP